MTAIRIQMQSRWCQKVRVWAVPATAAVAVVFIAHGDVARTNDSPAGHEARQAPTNSLGSQVQSVGPGLYDLGLIRLDTNRRQLRFPAIVNLVAGPVEYFLVHSRGKVHESVLRTEVEPTQLHLARLLLCGPCPEAAIAPESPPDTNVLRAESVGLVVSWFVGEIEHRVPAEELVFNLKSLATMSRGDWTYNGSWMKDGLLLAQRDGSVISIIADPDALINNPRPGREDDEIWQVRTNAVPVLNTPVSVTIQFPTNDAAAKP